MFDIAVANALEIMNSEEEKAFLIGQRKQPREGKISAKKDVKLAMKEKETKAKEARKEERKNRQKKFKETYYENNNDCSQGKFPTIFHNFFSFFSFNFFTLKH